MPNGCCETHSRWRQPIHGGAILTSSLAGKTASKWLVAGGGGSPATALQSAIPAVSGDNELLTGDREAMKKAVAQNWKVLEHATEEAKGDCEIVMTAVSQYGGALQYANEELKGNRELVLQAVTRDWRALRYAKRELLSDRGLIMTAVSQYGDALLYAAQSLRGDREIVMQAVSRNGEALQYAAEELKRDKEVVARAVSQDPRALQYASLECRGDREIVLLAVSAFGLALRWASEELRNDTNVMQEAFANSGSPPLAVGLKVALMSGRQCTQLFDVDADIEEVLEECALALDLDPDEVVECGALFSGTTEVESLHDLCAGIVNDVSLVMS